MSSSVLRQISALRTMTVNELLAKWQELNGETTAVRNKDYLFKRLAWRIQELAYGGLSEKAKERLEELAPDSLGEARKQGLHDDRKPTVPRSPIRDLRLPSPGTVLTRQYKGQEIRVTTLDGGFEWEGRAYRSLSAVAKAVTGAKWNGRLFFGLTERKR